MRSWKTWLIDRAPLKTGHFEQIQLKYSNKPAVSTPRQWKLVAGDGKQIYAASFRGTMWKAPPADLRGTRKPVLTYDLGSRMSEFRLDRAKNQIDPDSRWEEIV